MENTSHIENEIIINADGNLTVCGALAHKLYFANGFDIPSRDSLRSASNPNTALWLNWTEQFALRNQQRNQPLSI